MKQTFAVLAALAVSTLVACGGVEAVEPQEELGQESSALVSCSTECTTGPSLSCWGTTCSASNNHYVQCDGNYQYCPTTPPPPLDCSLSREACVNVLGLACSPSGSTRKCCIEDMPTGNCQCMHNGQWTCTVPVEDP
ncbi:hypothetical protein JKA73_04130 [Myxococcus xanthus]|uniref:hypothetical protein n=1 Tax=Myxococcus xanthus TaxID=34 RepID=UPI0019170726|nr:hypothetical protein [Myxococcus xanthus]QQR45333.1 hypothetical protein JKA73_04130 [Myxococcus xanthus]